MKPDETDDCEVYAVTRTTVHAEVVTHFIRADGFITEGPYLMFVNGGKVIVAYPHSSIEQFGIHRLMQDNFDSGSEEASESMAFVEFKDEPKDPWAELSGRAV